VNPALHTDGDRSVLRFERSLPHPVGKVWQAVTDPSHLSHWFPATMEIADLRPGGPIRFVFPGGELDGSDGVITELDPPHVFAFTWNGDPLRIELIPEAGGCRLVFTHGFGDRPMAGSFAAGWHTCLDALEAALAGGPAPEQAPGQYPARHDTYLDAFALGEGTVEDGAVRFERLLPHPVETVWAELTESTEPQVGAAPPQRTTNACVTAGPVTDAGSRRHLEYRDGSAGRVRWELTGGHPAGTRVVLTHTGADDQVASLAAWHTHLEVFADHLRGDTVPWPQDRDEELRKHYAEAR
jgi:uncharacterized protein YndB with AHSA1/START domain